MIASLVPSDDRQAWAIDSRRRNVTRATGLALDLNSVAKGYIIERATKMVVDSVSQISGMLLNLGGDLSLWGRSGGEHAHWYLDVQDPHHPAENAEPLTRLALQGGAVATSGGYQRFHTIGGRRYSHLIDPRTGYPAEAITAATVIAPCSTIANVLATTLGILDPRAGLRLVAETPGTACLLVTASGEVLRSPGFSPNERPLEDQGLNDPPTKNVGTPGAQAKELWPEGFQVSVAFELLKPAGGRVKRPYVAIWAEDATGKTVRTISVWGNQPRWIPELSVWWKAVKADKTMTGKVTRATRAPGKYNVVWDGKDDQGEKLPQGTYTIRVEVHREHGRHATQVGKIACLGESAEIKLDKNAEAAETILQYAKKP